MKYLDLTEQTKGELYYLIGQAAVHYLRAGGDREALNDLLDEAEDDAEEE